MIKNIVNKLFSNKNTEDNTQPPIDVGAIFQTAMQHHQAGELEQAESLYQQILHYDPNHVEALHFLGVLNHQRGQNDVAADLISKAVAINPNSSAMYANLGLVLQARGDFAGAIASYQQALSLEPDFMQAYFNLGNIYHSQAKLDEAIESYSRVIELNPNFATAHHALGAALQQQGKLAQAIGSYQQALAIQPDLFDAQLNLANLFIAQQNIEQAIHCYQQLLRLKPDYATGYFQLGNLFYGEKDFKQAIENYQKAISIKPDYVEALNNLGMTLQAQHDFDQALEYYQRALLLNPNSSGTYAAIGSLFQDQNRLDEAVESYQKSLKLQPDAVIYTNLGKVYFNQGKFAAAENSFRNALAINSDYVAAYFNLANSQYFQKKLEQAIKNYQKTLALQPNYPEAQDMLFYSQLNCCDWSNYQKNREKIIKAVNQGVFGYAPFSFLAVSNVAAYQKQCASIFVAHKYPAAKIPLAPQEPYQHKKIRLAYVSGDFRAHPISHLMVGLFEKHDRERFEVFAISLKAEENTPIGQRVKNAFDHFIPVVAKTDEQIATVIRDLEIDIAVDLMGFTSNQLGIFARKPAPIQVSYLGFPATMGADYIDYIFADSFAIPVESQAFFSEKIAYLPDCFQVNDDQRLISAKKFTRAELGLPETGFVFCSFNNPYKITPEVFEIWMRLLSTVPNSVLWLLSDNKTVQQNLKDEAVARGVEAERLIFAQGMENTEHLARFQLADLFLDTLPVNAGATASDALWAGVPIVTCAGEALASRMAGSLLYGIGLPELVTHNLTDYEALALKLATTPALLAETREKLVRNRTASPLFNTDRSRQHIEAAYINMWERYQQKMPPVTFAID